MQGSKDQQDNRYGNLTDIERKIRHELIERAIEGDKPINYFRFNAYLESKQILHDKEDLNMLFSCLRKILKFELDNNRPPLTVFVINWMLLQPGKGFYDICATYSKYGPKIYNYQKGFYKKQSTLTHWFWENKENWIYK